MKSFPLQLRHQVRYKGEAFGETQCRRPDCDKYFTIQNKERKTVFLVGKPNRRDAGECDPECGKCKKSKPDPCCDPNDPCCTCTKMDPCCSCLVGEPLEQS